MCQVDNRLLVGGCQILNYQLVLIGEGELNGHVQLARITFLTIGRDAVQSQ